MTDLMKELIQTTIVDGQHDLNDRTDGGGLDCAVDAAFSAMNIYASESQIEALDRWRDAQETIELNSLCDKIVEVTQKFENDGTIYY